MKNKVTNLDIVVRVIGGKPYYSLKYKELGNNYFNVGYSSYSLENVIAWKNEYFDMIQWNEDDGWIPVDEKLPEECVPVNIVWINRNPETYCSKIKDVPFSSTGVYYNGNWYWYSSACVNYLAEYGKCEWDLVDKAVDITHWQPLPEPPHMED